MENRLIDNFSEDELRQIAIELEERKKEINAKTKLSVRKILLASLRPLVQKVNGCDVVKGHEHLQYVRFDQTAATAVLQICDAIVGNTRTDIIGHPTESRSTITVAAKNKSLPPLIYNDYVELAKRISTFILDEREKWVLLHYD